jgi:hypothetical protein
METVQHHSLLTGWRDTGKSLPILNVHANYGTDPNGAYLSPASATTPICSLDGAQRNPGIGAAAGSSPHSAALHAGYVLRISWPKYRILGHKALK